MEKLNLFLSDLAAFIPNVISEYIAEGKVIELSGIALLVILIAVFVVEFSTASGALSCYSKDRCIRKKNYAQCTKYAAVISPVIAVLIILILYFGYPALKISAGENIYMTVIYGCFIMAVYAVAKHFYLKRK